MTTVFRAIALLWAICPAMAEASELKKADAAKLIASTGCRNAQVAAVINGIGHGAAATAMAVASPATATVLALCERSGKVVPESMVFFHDADLGWFYYELDTAGGRVRLWTANGYREVKADRAAEIAKARAALDALEPERKELERLTQGGTDPSGLMRARQIRERLSAAEEALKRAERMP